MPKTGNNNSFFNSIAIIAILVFVVAFIVNINRPPKTCQYRGCDKTVDDSGVYCFVHNENSDYNKEVREILSTPADPDTLNRCWVDGCYSKRGEDHAYCTKHECSAPGCLRQKKDGYNYCENHIDTANTGNHSSGASSSHTGSNSTASESFEMPDCDDYESYEEFMDDWDGCMPDGSNAEDYWDNW